ncbi:acyltransferase family protein [Maribellus mangrovi]|uniref:acyltransferase family protein n=1 Tax=Maribellus mangrovi TaxID=3133146 RepID=UPI0030ED15D7
MKRLRLPDLLKGIAIFFMIQVHIMELFIDYPGQSSVVGKISLFLGGPFTAMVFMMVMGYFVAASKKSLRQNMSRGIKIFVLGFLLNIGLNFHLLLKIKYADWPYNSWEYIFGVDILYLAGLSIIILAVIKRLPKKLQLPVSFGLLAAVLLLTGTMNIWLTFPERNYITPFIGGTYSWSYFPLFPWLAYPLAGYFFFFAQNGIQQFISGKKVFTSSAFLLIVFLLMYFSKMGFDTTINLQAYYHHTLKYGIWALGLLIIWSSIFYLIVIKYQASLFEKFLAWMGKNITLIYVVQWLIIGNIATAIFQTQPLNRFPLWLFGILGVTLFVSWLLAKTKIRLA